MLRREPRELYRLYDEEEFLSPEALAGPAAEVSAAGLTEHEAEATHEAPLEPSSPPIPRLAAQRRRRVTPAMVLAAGLGLLVVAAIEMHASVGRVTRPAQAPRFRSSGTVGRTSRRVGRRRPSRPAASAAEQSAGRGRRRVARDPNGSGSPMPGTAGDTTAANPTAPASTPHEFGFEQ